jgi:hypothetical protein
VALKQVRIFDSDRGNGIPITALREISILKSLHHVNVVNVLDVAVGVALDEIYMVMEYAEQVGGYIPFLLFLLLCFCGNCGRTSTGLQIPFVSGMERMEFLCDVFGIFLGLGESS